MKKSENDAIIDQMEKTYDEIAAFWEDFEYEDGPGRSQDTETTDDAR